MNGFFTEQFQVPMNIGSSAYEDRFIFPLPKFIFNQVEQVEKTCRCMLCWLGVANLTNLQLGVANVTRKEN